MKSVEFSMLVWHWISVDCREESNGRRIRVIKWIVLNDWCSGIHLVWSGSYRKHLLIMLYLPTGKEDENLC